jgi:ubiquinone/menaquinone biosynthesis C-methylase UbiE
MTSLTDRILVRTDHVCPWWFCWSFDNVIRKIFHNPEKIVKPFVNKGDTVADIGCGMGYFTIPLAQMVGVDGNVIAVDLQKKMLERVIKRAQKKNVLKQIQTQQATLNSLSTNANVDFVLAFWMIHEIPDRAHVFKELYDLLKDNGKLLIVEPIGHVSAKGFQDTVGVAMAAGFEIKENPLVSMSRACLMVRNKIKS